MTETLTELLPEELEDRMERLGEPPFRGRQIFRWVFGRGAARFEAMTDLPAALRKRLAEWFTIGSTEVKVERGSPDGTRKMLVKLRDGLRVETVMIPDGGRRTVCLSTQVGCPVGCTFCASGIGGVQRNMTAGEIVEQVLHVKRRLEEGGRIHNIVLMGIGEPLLNYGAVTKALRLMRAERGLHIGYNKITLSTVGILDKIPRLLEDGVTPNLAISLHAPDDGLRRALIPALREDWTISRLIEAGRMYRERARKDVTFEYVLLERINDEPEHAARLGRLLGGSRMKVNLIPYNPVEEFGYRPPSQERLDRFARVLGAHKVFVTVRRRRGDRIHAACGQLRARALGK